MEVMEARRKSLSDVPESCELSTALLERSPLLDRRASKSVSVFRLHNCRESSAKITPLTTISERASIPSISRSRSAPFHRYDRASSHPLLFHGHPGKHTPDHAQFWSSPQYRVNPVVKFDERLLPPERMNYGIAGYNTSRRAKRSGVVLRTTKTTTTARRPRSGHVWRVWTRRLRVRMIRASLRSACSRLMMRFRRRR